MIRQTRQRLTFRFVLPSPITKAVSPEGIWRWCLRLWCCLLKSWTPLPASKSWTTRSSSFKFFVWLTALKLCFCEPTFVFLCPFLSPNYGPISSSPVSITVCGGLRTSSYKPHRPSLSCAVWQLGFGSVSVAWTYRCSIPATVGSLSLSLRLLAYDQILLEIRSVTGRTPR